MQEEKSAVEDETENKTHENENYEDEAVSEGACAENIDNAMHDSNNLNTDRDMDERYGHRSGHYDLRPRKPRDYSHMHATLEHIALTQYNLKRGLKEFGTAGMEAVKKELQQLHDRDVLTPMYVTDLNIEERNQALPYLMFLKQKRTGQVKGRGCADGRKQRIYYNKEDATSPTVAIESVMLTSITDAMEERDVATVDIPAAFMQAEMDEVVFMKITGTMVEVLVSLDEVKYKKFTALEHGQSVLYVKLNKALYGTLRAALLFWKKLSATLQEWGFIINPYDACVANKEISGKQCTIIWHVDDLKISHCNAEIVSMMIDKLEGVFGKEAPLTVHRGVVHEYLGMKIDFSRKGKVMIDMKEYVNNILCDAPHDMSGTAKTPASNFLFQINNKNPVPLERDVAEMFHSTVAKLLFLCKRARPDIQTAISFLCTRVKEPDVDDYKKLGRVIRYLRGTNDMILTLEHDNSHIIKWWVDASFACHNDMRSHTGGVMTLGKGAAYATSTRQKLNSRSSTEGELVAVNDVMPHILWTRNFLISQGITVKDNVVFQDNKSAILLEENGKASSSKRTRHINIRYFFVKDRINQKELRIQHCGAQDMIGDFFTKPLQGALFYKYRRVIMNLEDPEDPLDASTIDSSQLH